MKYAHSIRYVLSLGLLLSTSIYANNTKSHTPVGMVADRYLKSFDLTEEKLPSLEDFRRENKKLTLQIRELSEGEKRKIAFDLLEKHVQQNVRDVSQVVDQHFVDKMELIYGGAAGKDHLLSKLNRTNNTMDEVSLAWNLTQPANDLASARANQAILKELITNDRLLEQLDTLLQRIKSAENNFYSFWQDEHPVNSELFKQVYFGKSLGLFNKNSGALELKTRLGNLLQTYGLTALPTTIFGGSAITHYALKRRNFDYRIWNSIKTGFNISRRLMRYGNPFGRNYTREVTDVFADIYRAAPNQNLMNNQEEFIQHMMQQNIGDIGNRFARAFGYQNFNDLQQNRPQTPLAAWDRFGPQSLGDLFAAVDLARISNPNAPVGKIKLFYGSLVLLFGGVYGYSMWKGYQDFKMKTDIGKHIQSKLIGVATYVNTLKELGNAAAANPVLQNYLVAIDYLQQLNNPGAHFSPNAQSLINLLNKNTFKGSASFFSLTGRALAGYELMKETKDELIAAVCAGGELGALVSVAKAFKANQKAKGKYCFVQFVEGNQPYVKATKFWNPRLDANIAVPNSLEMGDGNMRHVILTGGNGLGKSTIMKGLLYTMHIAQCFGIAPAEQLIMTPFAKFHCHMNVSDDIAQGLSGFTAELALKDRILQQHRDLPRSAFIFTLMDELFKSTNPEDAAQLSKQLARDLAGYENSMTMLATHLAPVTELEKEGAHANYHPGSTQQPNDKPAKPTFTLEPGASFDHNAVALYNFGK